ncbi:MAG: ATP-dependent DNA helicase RecG, partial [Bacteroidota bacterium]
KTMCETNDGFKIAETDLQLRGPGDADGTRQSGVLDLKLADLSKDARLISPARDAAFRLLESDPQLVLPEHHSIRIQLEKMIRRSGDWGRIS